MATIELTKEQLLQVYMGLEARIEELDNLIDANKGYPDAEAQIEDWEGQKFNAKAARIIVGRA